jgi:hypothetical protein
MIARDSNRFFLLQIFRLDRESHTVTRSNMPSLSLSSFLAQKGRLSLAQ